MGAFEVQALAWMEASVKYHPDVLDVLTSTRHPGQGPCVVGSLTGAVSSQSVTEEHEGALSTVGHRAMCVKA